MGGEDSGAALLERDGALSVLQAAFGGVVAGQGAVVLVSGEAGIGKTSLVRAFVAAERRATRVLAGACDDLAVPRPLGPFLEIAHELPGLASELGTGGVDAPRVVLDELRRDGATICIVEDAHWADEATIDVLTFVARRVEATSSLLLVYIGIHNAWDTSTFMIEERAKREAAEQAIRGSAPALAAAVPPPSASPAGELAAPTETR